jgi:hypothetical protein
MFSIIAMLSAVTRARVNQEGLTKWRRAAAAGASPHVREFEPHQPSSRRIKLARAAHASQEAQRASDAHVVQRTVPLDLARASCT